MRRFLLLGSLGMLAGCFGSEEVLKAEPVVGLQPHEIADATTQAFTRPYAGLTLGQLDEHRKGDAAFEAIFVAGTGIQGGLGPLFHTNSCVACHAADGRGSTPQAGEIPVGVLLRTSMAGLLGQAPLPVTGFGGQLQPRAIAGETPEVLIDVAWVDSLHAFPDGETISLRRPVWTVIGTSIPFPAGALVGARLAPPVFGLGALEAVDDAEILRREDPEDRDKDSISGRANRIATAGGGTVIGRFGWKANTPDLLTQAAAAYRNDMGITNHVFPTEPCKGFRASCDDHPVEVDSATLAAVAFYTRSLAVPIRRRTNDAQVLRGEALFKDFGCAQCHVPELPYGAGRLLPTAPAGKARAFTDLLLHDMGEGLADGRPDHSADGREWRTAPLWGIGLTEMVHGKLELLHDGRARSFEEAILWHGGEANRAKERWRKAASGDRKAMVSYLRSL